MEKFLKELKKLAKKHGIEMLDECSYCGETKHDATGTETHHLVTFIEKLVE